MLDGHGLVEPLFPAGPVVVPEGPAGFGYALALAVRRLSVVSLASMVGEPGPRSQPGGVKVLRSGQGLRQHRCYERSGS
jgi:hypothetical protein